MCQIMGAVIIDYFIVSKDLGKCCMQMEVGMSILSSHMSLEMKLKTKGNVTQTDRSVDSRECVEKIVWDVGLSQEFVERMRHSS